ncbi:DMT family transporter [Sphingobium sp. AN558]|uniref:DMT family transporter n=1 Tax=Sphingobium sp. AN558 TaxID=3133442 RepID=UPI0030BE0427
MRAILASIIFVLIWSTGFIVARAVTPHAPPELVLAVRLILTTALLGALAIYARQPLPRGRRLGLHLAAGIMMHGLYLGLGWWAITRGMPAGIMALLGSLQPLIVAVVSVPLLREHLPRRSWVGLFVAIGGVACVLTPAIERADAGAIAFAPIVAGLIAVLCMAGGTLIQRGSIATDGILMSGAVQNAGAAMVMVCAVMIGGEWRWDGSPVLWAGLAWSVLGLSAAGLSLLVWLVRHQGATRMSMLLLLVPPLAAIEGWLLFGERLAIIQIAGFALALGGVLLGRSSAKAPDVLAEPA